MSLEAKSLTSAAREKRRSRALSPIIDTVNKTVSSQSIVRTIANVCVRGEDSQHANPARQRTSFLFTDTEGLPKISEVTTAREKRRMHHDTHTDELRVILPEPERRKGPLLCLPYPSDVFPTEYNERLPEWRWRAGYSAFNEHWRNAHEYVLVALACSIGLNNFVYFPMMVLKYQHGAFLYLYIFIEVCIGFPLLFLHLSLGQFTAKDAVLVYTLFPLARGVGISVLIYNLLSAILLTIQLSWISFYIFATALNISFTPSFSWTLPWKKCDVLPEVVEHHVYCKHISAHLINATNFFCEHVFFHDKVLGLRGNCTIINDQGEHLDYREIHWPLLGCALFVLALAFLIKLQGIRGIGRFVIVMIPIMVVMLLVISLVEIILSYDQVVMDAALNGIIDFFTFANGFHDLGNFEIWFATANYVVTSLTLESGGMLFIASQAQFQSSAHYHALYIIIAQICLSVVSGIIIFGHLGKLANGDHVTSIEFQSRSRTRSYLLYISSAIERLNDFGAPFLFFFLIMVLGIGLMKLITHLAIIISPLKVRFPLLKKDKWRILINAVGVLFIAILVIPFNNKDTTLSYALVTMFQHEPLDYCPLMLTTLTAATFIYGYGLKRLRQDIDFMLHYYPNKIYCVVWYLIPPICIVLIIGYTIDYCILERTSIVRHWKPAKVYQDLIWFVFVLIFTPIIVVALWTVYLYYKHGALSEIRRPMEKWTHASLASMPHSTTTKLQTMSSLPRAEAITKLSSHPSRLPSRPDTETKLNV